MIYKKLEIQLIKWLKENIFNIKHAGVQLTYKEISEQIIRWLGGKQNIISISHNNKRLKFSLNDKEKVSIGNIKRIYGISNAIFSEGHVHVIIEKYISEIYDEISCALDYVE